MTSTVRKISLAAATFALLAACGEPTETTEAPPAAAPAAEPPSAPPMAAEPPVSRRPEIPPPSAHIAVNPGLYRAEGVELSLSALRFELEIPAEDVSATGSYEVINGILKLSATEGETGDGAFPLDCRLSRAGPTITFEDVRDESCGVLDGLHFERETRME